jgi:cation:H+ antiporter
MFINILILLVGMVLMMRGADVFVDGASYMAKKFHIPEIIIGLTIVAMGTSAPEAAVSISSVIRGANGVGVGNVLGSNIANILFILGITAMISALPVQKNTVRFEIPFVCFVSVLLMFMGAIFGQINFGCASVLCFLFCLFLFYLFKVSSNTIETPDITKTMPVWKMVLFILVGIAALVLGSELTVKSAVNIANILHISERVIGLTIIAFGTSLPELVTCIVAAIKKKPDLAIGNIIGSNIFNILFVLGVTGLIQPVAFESAFLVDSAIGIVATVLLWIFTYRNFRLGKIGGFMFVLLYVMYVIYLIK